jgi:hypothetical protein
VVYQPVVAMAAAGRKELTSSPSVGTIQIRVIRKMIRCSGSRERNRDEFIGLPPVL